jgi:hypothetical protein
MSSLSGNLLPEPPVAYFNSEFFFHPSFTKTKHGTGDGNIKNCTTNPIYSG